MRTPFIHIHKHTRKKQLLGLAPGYDPFERRREREKKGAKKLSQEAAARMQARGLPGV